MILGLGGALGWPRRLPERAREQPGSARECPGDAQERPVHPRGALRGARGALPDLPWVPFGLHLGSVSAPSSHLFRVRFSIGFSIDFGSILVSILAPFWRPNSTSEALECEKVDLQKTMLSLRKTLVFDLGECPGAAKIAFGRHQKRTPTNTSKKDAKMEPKGSQNGSKMARKWEPKRSQKATPKKLSQ